MIRAGAALRVAGLLLASCGWLCAPAGAAAGDARAERFEASLIVAFGDVHGAHGALVGLLQQVSVIGADGNWTGGTTHLVSLGDLLDRGPESRRVLDLLRRLETQAASAGGRVHVVLGNHELMNLTGDLRYVSRDEFAAFARDGVLAAGTDTGPAAASAEDDASGATSPGRRALLAAFAPDGEYGAWLLGRPATVIVNDTAFVHGGLSVLAAATTAPAMNDAMRTLLIRQLTLRAELVTAGLLAPDTEVNDAADQLSARLDSAAPPLDATPANAAGKFITAVRDPLFGPDGPFWYRGNARCHALLESPALDEVLSNWQVSRVVVGHTPTIDHRVHARLDGRVLLADTGMLASYYHGRASAVIMEQGNVNVIYADDPAGPSTPAADDGSPLYPLAEAEVLDLLARHPGSAEPETWALQTVTSEQSISVRFTASSDSEQSAALAAWQLDRMLGLNLAAPVTAVRRDGEDGIVTGTWAGVISEAERAAAQTPLANECARGNAFDLLYVFDALIGNQTRTPETLVYDPRTWRLGSIDHAESFGRGRKLPRYLDNTPRRVPPPLAERLRALDETALRQGLAGLLNSRQIRAVLARRDVILNDWTIGY